jgi:hypothetical protein
MGSGLPLTSCLEAKMKHWVIAGTLAGAVALSGSVLAQQPTPPASGTSAQAPAAAGQTGDTKAKPAKRAARHAAPKGNDQQGDTRTPKQQPTTAQDPNAPDAAMALGTVHIPRGVKADGKPLAAGVYQVRLTSDSAKPDAVGTSGKLERWVEFVQRGQVKGREVVSIVPQSEISLVQKDAPPPANGSKVQMLKGNDYLRVWINKGGNHYLIHLVA